MSALTLVCFAVPQEAKSFQKLIRGRADVRVLITGMGAKNAGRATREVLKKFSPARVFTCGFAGALDPSLQIGDVLCARDTPVRGVKSATFHCATRVAVTAEEKSKLRAQTGADAVEMESAVIARVCREAGVPCVTLRAVSDTAQEDLPLDFNTLLDGNDQLSPIKLASAVLKAPQKIPALLRLGRNSSVAAHRLAEALVSALAL